MDSARYGVDRTPAVTPAGRAVPALARISTTAAQSSVTSVPRRGCRPRRRSAKVGLLAIPELRRMPVWERVHRGVAGFEQRGPTPARLAPSIRRAGRRGASECGADLRFPSSAPASEHQPGLHERAGPLPTRLALERLFHEPESPRPCASLPGCRTCYPAAGAGSQSRARVQSRGSHVLTIELLDRRQGLGCIWLIAHGSKLSKREVNDISVPETCRLILKPEVPLSLRCGRLRPRPLCHTPCDAHLSGPLAAQAAGQPRAGRCAGAAAPDAVAVQSDRSAAVAAAQGGCCCCAAAGQGAQGPRESRR